MPKKLHEDTIFLKEGKKYIPIGRLYDRDYIGYGSYFITNTKYGRSMHWIGASPNPDFIGLETAIEESRDNIRLAIRDLIIDFINDKDFYKSDHIVVDNIIQAIRQTFVTKKQKMLDIIGQ